MFEVRETGNPEVPLYFGEGLRIEGLSARGEARVGDREVCEGY